MAYKCSLKEVKVPDFCSLMLISAGTILPKSWIPLNSSVTKCRICLSTVNKCNIV